MSGAIAGLEAMQAHQRPQDELAHAFGPELVDTAAVVPGYDGVVHSSHLKRVAVISGLRSNEVSPDVRGKSSLLASGWNTSATTMQTFFGGHPHGFE